MSTQQRSVLSPAARTEHLGRLRAATAEAPLDVLVVGGGVNGAGAAFDAATRGLNVGLVESEDWASGTSSRSSKLMHGGLRYLQMLDFTLVAEALRERDLLLTRTAPHLVKPVKFVFPFFRKVIDRGFIGSGVALYDAMQSFGRKRAVPFHRHLLHRKMLEVFPGLDGDKAVGALEYYDAQMDDARFVMMLVRSAAQHDAAVASRTRVINYLHEGGKVVGARVRDELSGDQFDIHARATILAGGVWTQDQQDLAGAETGLEVLASKGIHIVVPREKIAAAPDTGIITQTEKSVLFLIPWDEYWVIGTTDTPWEHDPRTVAATGADIDYVIDHANAVLGEPLTREDVIGVYAGLRPLLQPVRKGSDSGSAKVSREHTVMEVEPGLSAIAGGKYTTYRVMAEDVVDFALKDLDPARRSLTRAIPVIGAQGYPALVKDKQRLMREYGFDEVRVDRLLFRYGDLLTDVLALVAEDPDLGLPLEHAPRYLRAEALYAVRAEGALHLADVLERRTRLDYETRHRGVDAAEEIAALIGPELGWDEQTARAEIEAYRAKVAARLEAESVQTDEQAAQLLGAALDTGAETQNAGATTTDADATKESR
ncbi:glycerol-3-phosphate dehydrogenase/oxidase [Brachybacterium sp. UMB0905]|uniref:glycerol-3-phosphate dehydrogenase/oxidase n=1 Tax=Brachybacterium sp. UMB0905 TaxID=2069310 RepID=UPI000C80C306|nr:glycerol-3-phosphate dehydrogenase/oxidase [Brachybacterium sp. UMB0905]PMC76129.1 glycerol-3-phosphate dehydrogenase [Brachybacterium sp. UMB0905]